MKISDKRYVSDFQRFQVGLLVSSICDTLSHREISEEDWELLEQSYNDIKNG